MDLFHCKCLCTDQTCTSMKNITIASRYKGFKSKFSQHCNIQTEDDFTDRFNSLRWGFLGLEWGECISLAGKVPS